MMVEIISFSLYFNYQFILINLACYLQWFWWKNFSLSFAIPSVIEQNAAQFYKIFNILSSFTLPICNYQVNKIHLSLSYSKNAWFWEKWKAIFFLLNIHLKFFFLSKWFHLHYYRQLSLYNNQFRINMEKRHFIPELFHQPDEKRKQKTQKRKWCRFPSFALFFQHSFLTCSFNSLQHNLILTIFTFFSSPHQNYNFFSIWSFRISIHLKRKVERMRKNKFFILFPNKVIRIPYHFYCSH